MRGRSRVLVVDDDPAVLSVLRRSLLLGGYDVVVAEDGERALAMATAERPNLVVLDVMLPGIDGFAVCRQMRAEEAEVPILMLTAKDTVPDRVSGLDSGADDYLVKPFSVDELLARVRALLRRVQKPGNSDEVSHLDLRIDLRGREAFRGERMLKLTAREFELLLTFVRHAQQALSRDQLAQLVWGYAFEGESNFIDVAVKNLRTKLEEGGESRLIQTVRGYGYALREE